MVVKWPMRLHKLAQFLQVGQIIKKSLMKINSRIIPFLLGVISEHQNDGRL